MQLGGYKAGYESQQGRIFGTTILQLFNDGKYILYDTKDEYFMFLACLQIYRFNERNK